MIFPSLKKGGAGGGSQIHKTFPPKLNLLENYNFIIGEPLRHCVPPPLEPSARGGLLKDGTIFFNLPSINTVITRLR